MRSVLLVLLVLVATAGAQPAVEKNGPHLPPFPVAPDVPKPMPSPDTAMVLEKDVQLLIDHDSECVVESFPPSLLEITERQVPAGMTWTLTGKFVDAKDASKVFEGDREFKGPCYIYRVKAKEKGEGWLYILPVGGKKSDAIRRKVQSGLGPKPPPVPPDIDPPPPANSFRVIFIYEAADNLTPDQRGIVFGKATEDWLNANCTGGKTGWRRRDQNAGGENDPTMAALWKAVQTKITTVPCVAVERDSKVDILLLDATPAAMIETFKKYRGK